MLTKKEGVKYGNAYIIVYIQPSSIDRGRIKHYLYGKEHRLQD